MCIFYERFKDASDFQLSSGLERNSLPIRTNRCSCPPPIYTRLNSGHDKRNSYEEQRVYLY